METCLQCVSLAARVANAGQMGGWAVVMSWEGRPGDAADREVAGLGWGTILQVPEGHPRKLGWGNDLFRLT